MKLAFLNVLVWSFVALVVVLTMWSVRWARRRNRAAWVWGGLTLLISTITAVVVVLFLGAKFDLPIDGKNGWQPSLKHATEHDDRVQFQLMNTHFDVPKQYFKGVAVSGGGIAESASLWALLPNFEGYDKAVNHHDFFEVNHKGRRIQIMLLPRGRRMKVPQIVDRHLRDPTVVLGKHAGKYDEMRYGMEYYRSNNDVQPSIYIYRKNGTPELLFRCDDTRPSIPSYKTYPGCQVYWDYNDEVAVDFDFSINYLPQWQDIMTNLQQLLGGGLDVKAVPQLDVSATPGE